LVFNPSEEIQSIILMDKRTLPWWGKLSNAARIFWLACTVLLCFGTQAPAHICGPPVRIVRPGDLFYYYILSDVIETAPSSYHLIAVTNLAVVSAYPSTPFTAYYYGEFELEV
jgi:hypothetical protein